MSVITATAIRIDFARVFPKKKNRYVVTTNSIAFHFCFCFFFCLVTLTELIDVRDN